ncbi:MAG: GNAT family N-acetyltransferase [Eubacteriales bacterium]|nr:GNAT family N-acetyltransferase [Eubacteriales bacterium]
MEFDNHDARIRYVHLLLRRDDWRNLPHYELPQGYCFVTYAPGDEKDWVEIERSAREFSTREEGEKAWAAYYGGRESALPGRMFFVENERGEKVATATAYEAAPEEPDAGWLHWVAVRREDQGRGLARPLIAHALERLAREYGSAVVSTQTTTWLACRLYLDFGFYPACPQQEREGWRIVKALTHHPALDAFDEASLSEILAQPGKLVRDRIPEIIRRQGDEPMICTLDSADYLAELERKLGEEVAEYLQSKELEELADVAEVVRALCEARGHTVEDLERLRMQKRVERGGFAKRIYWMGNEKACPSEPDRP